MDTSVAVVFTVLGGIVSLIGLYFAWKQTSAVSAERQAAAVAKEVKDATEPLLAQLAQQRENFREQLQAVRDVAARDLATRDRSISRLESTIDRMASRIDELEDELRRGRGHGDNDAARQPPGG